MRRLEAHHGKLSEIEHGQHIPAFRIVAPSAPDGDDDTSDFEPAPFSRAAMRASDDDIPYASDDEIPF